MKLVAADLDQVLANLGLKLGKSGQDEVWALCPGHDDSNPTSFSVNRESGASFCFACGYRRSDLVALTCDVLHLDAWAAAVWLREHGASLSARIERIRDRVPTSKRGKPRTSSGYSLEGEFAVFRDVPRYALDERLLRREAADLYDIRWTGDNYVIPIKDRRGKLHGWQERRKPRPKNYPEEVSKSQFLFGAYEFLGDRAIIVESPLDAVRLHSEGYEGAVSSFGSWVSPAQVRILESLADKLVIAMDNDEAGQESTERLLAHFTRKMPVWVLSYDGVPPGQKDRVKDPGDMEWDEIAFGLRNATYAARSPRARTVVRR